MNQESIVQHWSPQQKTVLEVTDNAKQYLKKMLAKSQTGQLRFGIKKSGCTGYAYVWEPSQQNADDTVVNLQDLVIVIDPTSLPIIMGIKIDYIREGLNYHLSYNNPNEKASCGCGESFSV